MVCPDASEDAGLCGFVFDGFASATSVYRSAKQPFSAAKACPCTFLQLRRRRLCDKGCFFERAPFEVPLVTTTFYLSLVTLLAGRFRLIALQSFCFARHAA